MIAIGTTSLRTPICNIERFGNLKVRMRAFIDAIDEELFETILNGPYQPLCLDPQDPAKMVPKPKNKWSDEDKRMVGIDNRGKNYLYHALEEDLFEHQFKTFEAKPGEELTEMFERFNILLIYLRMYGKVYDLEDSNLKFIKSLPYSWDSKTIAIRESKYLS
ncbi:hypothetical protein Droror1_Dr00012240, partial [Drosera rotundifolia]